MPVTRAVCNNQKCTSVASDRTQILPGLLGLQAKQETWLASAPGMVSIQIKNPLLAHCRPPLYKERADDSRLSRYP